MIRDTFPGRDRITGLMDQVHETMKLTFYPFL